MSPENRSKVMMSNMKLSKNNYSMGMLKGNNYINKKRMMSLQRPKTNKNQRNQTMQLLDQQRLKSANQTRYNNNNINNSLNLSANKGVLSGGVQGQSQ